MQDEGFTHVAVQSLHTIGGAEYHDLRRTVGDFKSLGGFQRVILGYPLLSSQKDMQRAVNAILETVTKAKGSDKIGGFIEVNIGFCFKKRIKPVDPEIFKPEWILVTQDCE